MFPGETEDFILGAFIGNEETRRHNKKYVALFFPIMITSFYQ